MISMTDEHQEIQQLQAEIDDLRAALAERDAKLAAL